MIRVSNRNNTTGSNNRDLRMFDILDCRCRRYPVKFRHRKVCLKRLAFHLLYKHLDGTFGSSFFREVVDTDSSFVIIFFIRSKNLFACCHLLDQIYDGRKYFSHCSCGVSSLYCDHVLAEHINTRVLLIGCCQHRNTESFFHCFTDRSTCNAVTSCVECRSCKEDVRFIFLYHVDNRIGCFIQIFSEIVVTADYCSYDFIIFTKSLCKSCSWSKSLFSYFRFVICLFLTADTGKELVNIMNNFIFCHFGSSFQILISPCCKVVKAVCDRRCNDDLKLCLKGTVFIDTSCPSADLAFDVIHSTDHFVHSREL